MKDLTTRVTVYKLHFKYIRTYQLLLTIMNLYFYKLKNNIKKISFKTLYIKWNRKGIVASEKNHMSASGKKKRRRRQRSLMI
jgi:hypothetical protein